jgi:16S rRNA G966 N2-methylase RsmD
VNTQRVNRDRPPKSPRNERPAPRTKRDARVERMAAREHTRDQRALKDKRALSGMQPPTSKSGDEAVAEVLFEALMAASEDDADTHTHGFHSYPARLHPSIAAVLLDRLARPSSSKGGDGARVVDPFCGSGTVLVEARLRGLPAWGIDLNPVALRVAEVKCDVRTPEERMRFAQALAHVVEQSKERVRAKVDARAPLTKEQAARFEGHVLKELAGLHKEIGAIESEADRRALFVVMSSILVKVSTQRSETAQDQGKGRRMGRFIPTEMFEAKGQELIERWASLADAAHAHGPTPKLTLDDARNMHDVLTKPADLIITSPPYAGTYDYAEHHALRAPWLGVSLERIAQDELGSRRTLTAAGAVQRWDEQVKDVLRSIARVLADDGLAILIVGDGEIGGTRVRADEQLRRLLEPEQAPLEVLGTASAPRLDWRGGADRQEHLVALAPRR